MTGYFRLIIKWIALSLALITLTGILVLAGCKGDTAGQGIYEEIIASARAEIWKGY